MLSRALQLQPDDPAANYEMAKLLLTMNQLKNAEKLLEHASQLDPTNAVIHFRLSTVYHRLGQTADADREVAQYHKYEDLKETLQNTWKALDFNPEKPDMFDSGKEK